MIFYPSIELIKTNRLYHPDAAGRTKVINTHLNLSNRKELVSLQVCGTSDSHIFAVTDAIHLPEIIALVGDYDTMAEAKCIE